MTSRQRDNLYHGVNAHLQSALQTPTSGETGMMMWASFHSDHITNISEFLNERLPEGYVARTEQSLQVLRDDFVPQRREPDVTIYQSGSGMSSAESAIAAVEFALEDTFDDEEAFIPATVIRRIEPHPVYGEIVARIELISPTNKRERSGLETYRHARHEALLHPITLLEIDYIHEYPPVPRRIPVYPDQSNSRPYNVSVSNSRPTLHQGRFFWYGVAVNQEFPAVVLPLDADNSAELDMNIIYDYTFRRGRWGDGIDYAQLPARFETYHPRDQAVIQAKMAGLA